MLQYIYLNELHDKCNFSLQKTYIKYYKFSSLKIY